MDFECTEDWNLYRGYTRLKTRLEVKAVYECWSRFSECLAIEKDRVK